MGKDEVGLLQQRRIEAKVFKAFLIVLEQELGSHRARSIAASVVRDLALEKGREYRKQHPEGSLEALANLWRKCAEGGALDIEFMEQTENCLRFRVNRCGYAEAYDEMGLSDVGSLLSCDRDEAFLEGYSDAITMDRSPTIMEGGGCCDFVYRIKK